METKASFKVNFKNGIAEIPYPNIMKYSSTSTIACNSIFVPGVRKENFEKHFNVLGTFFLKQRAKCFTFKTRQFCH